MTARLLTPAIDEIVAAAKWYEEQRPGLGEEFWRLVDREIAAIESNPQQYARSDFASAEFDLRYAYVSRFRYVIHFSVEAGGVLIVAVTHAGREPGYWLDRLGPDGE